MRQNKLSLFGKKLPAWMLLTALIVVGAGAATGLVLKDQIDGTTTIAVSQAIRVGTPTNGIASDADEFLGTVDDDGMAWAAHFEANNGDIVVIDLPVYNYAGNDDVTVCLLTLDVPEGITVMVVSEYGDFTNPPTHPNPTAEAYNTVQINDTQWKFGVVGPNGLTWGNYLYFELALEDALPTGFYTISGTIVPLNV